MIAASALLAGGWWWSATRNFDGLSYCELHHYECDGLGAESLAPWFLWPFTGFTSLLICVFAAVTAPTPKRQRLVWALMIGATVFVAHRNNVLWAAAVATLAVWAVARITDDPLHTPPPT